MTELPIIIAGGGHDGRQSSLRAFRHGGSLAEVESIMNGNFGNGLGTVFFRVGEAASGLQAGLDMNTGGLRRPEF